MAKIIVKKAKPTKDILQFNVTVIEDRSRTLHHVSVNKALLESLNAKKAEVVVEKAVAYILENAPSREVVTEFSLGSAIKHFPKLRSFLKAE